MIRILCLLLGTIFLVTGCVATNRLADASREGDIVQLLIDLGADINARGALQTTALIEAASRGRVETVELLLSNGANIHAENKYGNTAMAGACFYDHKEIQKILKAHGAKDVIVYTLGDIEALMGHVCIFNRDCEKGGYVTCKTRHGDFQFLGCKLVLWNSPFLDRYLRIRKMKIFRLHTGPLTY
jgi:ankyrin repeat protein